MKPYKTPDVVMDKSNSDTSHPPDKIEEQPKKSVAEQSAIKADPMILTHTGDTSNISPC